MALHAHPSGAAGIATTPEPLLDVPIWMRNAAVPLVNNMDGNVPNPENITGVWVEKSSAPLRLYLLVALTVAAVPDGAAVETAVTSPLPFTVITGMADELPKVPGPLLTVARVVVVEPDEEVMSPLNPGIRPLERIPLPIDEAVRPVTVADEKLLIPVHAFVAESVNASIWDKVHL